MTDDRFQQLIAQWRAHADDLRAVPPSVTATAAIGWLSQCADDLEALLAERPQPQEAHHESRRPDGDQLTTGAEVSHAASNGRPKNLHGLGEGASVKATRVTEAGSEPADSHTKPLGSPTP